MNETERLDPRLWQRVKEIFQEAVEAPAADRETLVGRLCAGEPFLMSQVRDMLAADDALGSGPASGSFLETPPDVSGILAAMETDSAGPLFPAAGTSAPAIGAVLGGYRIVGRLGEGGMGIVYEAEQQSPKRRVALKVVRGGLLLDEAGIRLFQREAHALARLRHPGIAAIYESGATPDGHHFFAMELVDGLPLHDYLRERSNGLAIDAAEIRARLGLFLEICDILSYAHQHGVIHHDLKPSNILVLRETSGRGDSSSRRSRIKLVDFGLARLVDSDATATLARSSLQSIKGTLSYMSPEQAQGNPDEIDLRSDIYSLGVLLYEMLTGRLPLDLHHKMLPEALRIIGEDPPPPPSRFRKELAGDLETILLKTLDKDPGRRYQSVAGLADDVQRHLADLPIQATPPTLVYQLRKLARRHRTAALLGAALFLAVVLGGFGTTIGMIRARKAAELARQEAETAEEVSSFMEDLFKVSNPGEARANSITARELLDAGVARIDTSLAHQPAVRGRLLGVMGQVYRNLGLFREARPLLEQALQLRRGSLRPDDPLLADHEYAFGSLLRRLGEYDKARGHYQASLEIRERAFGPDDPAVAASLTGLANIKLETGDYPGARPLYERCIRIIEKARGTEHPDLALYLSNLAMVHRAEGDYAGALPIVQRAVSIQEKALGPDDPGLTYDLVGLGATLRGLEDYDGSRRALERVLAIQTKTVGPEHVEVAETLGEIGSTLAQGGNHPAAREYLEKAAALFEKTLGPGNVYTARALDNVAMSARMMGDHRTAIDLSRKSLATLEAALAPGHPSVITVLERLGGHHAAAGEIAVARELFQRGLAIQAEAHGPESDEARVFVQLLASIDGRPGGAERP
jgi:serine/threonine protein kinase/tetratricopeptide (TPR) repeat protein